MMHSYKNPVIPGYHPDPSICRVGEDFYLVTSTFEFFPGVPIFHSRNLVNWEPIGHCLTDEEQLPLEGCRPSGGIFAPTIRYHEGMFYMITTNVTGGGNFIVHTRDIRGKWSKPAWIAHQGIDPSLFFDDDGKVYFTGTGMEDGIQVTSLFEIDPLTGKQLSPTVAISEGCGGICPEAPHLYKRDGYYYLMLAEGGTEYGHMVTIQRSTSPLGPYEPCPHNPILTHRHRPGPIKATGHADIVEDQNGNWWLVCLGIRPLKSNMLHNLGRETFLSPMVWDDTGWPVIGNNGALDLTMQGPLPAPPLVGQAGFADDFTGEAFSPQWNWLRNPDLSRYERRPKEGRLLLHGTTTTLDTPNASPVWLGVRQPQVEACAQAVLEVNPAEGQRAGLCAYYADGYHYAAYVTRSEGRVMACLVLRAHNIQQTFCRPLEHYEGEITFRVQGSEREYTFFYRLGDGEWVELGSGITAALCTEATWMMTFTGTYYGVFSEKGTAAVRDFEMTPARK